MDKQRLMVIISNLLIEMTKTTDMDQNTYLQWLKLEVGVSEDEIKELEENGLFPLMQS